MCGELHSLFEVHKWTAKGVSVSLGAADVDCMHCCLIERFTSMGTSVGRPSVFEGISIGGGGWGGAGDMLLLGCSACQGIARTAVEAPQQ